MAIHHVLLRPFVALIASFLLALAGSVTLLVVLRRCADFIWDLLKRLWQYIFVVLMTTLLMSLCFTSLMKYDDTLDQSVDMFVKILGFVQGTITEAIANFSPLAWCASVAPRPIAAYCFHFMSR